MTKPVYVEYLFAEWNLHERAHADMEKTPGWDSELAQYLARRTSEIALLLLEKGWLTAGYTNPEKPYEMQFEYQPEVAEKILSRRFPAFS